MHPIERLRFVARAQGVDDRLIAVEATAALMTFADDPAAMVAACRRVLARQPGCGRLWWACARLLTAQDVWATAQETITMLEDDPTEAALRYALGGLDEDDPPQGRSVVPEVHRAAAVGAGRVLLTERSEVGRGADARWIVVPVGTHLADQMWAALSDALANRSDGPGRAPMADLDTFTHVVGPHGPVPSSALGPPECEVAPELFTLQG